MAPQSIQSKANIHKVSTWNTVAVVINPINKAGENSIQPKPSIETPIPVPRGTHAHPHIFNRRAGKNHMCLRQNTSRAEWAVALSGIGETSPPRKPVTQASI